jgi:hypothetical protein
MATNEEKAMIKQDQQAITNMDTNVPMGFEDEEAGDMIIPRVKVIQTLSPERKDKIAEEGDIINSLTKQKLNGMTFIPVFKFNNNIDWRDRRDGGGIRCIARDGKIGEGSDGSRKLCAQCKRCEFDNTKQGRDAAPKCTKYINFFGFFAGERMPIILSFAKTNFNEGKKLYSLAKVTMQNMWNHGYTLDNKKMAKNGNEWYIMVVNPAGPTSAEDRAFAASLYQSYRTTIQQVAMDLEDASTNEAAPKVDTDATEF